MTADQTRHLLRKHRDALNRHEIDALVGFYADDAVLASPMFDTVRGKPAIRASFERLFKIFPDYHVQMSDALSICEGNRAAEFSTTAGTHSVELFGLPPTGHQIEYHAARLFTFRDGLIVYEQRLYDFGGVLERLEKTRIDRELQVASVVQHTMLGQTTRVGPYFEATGSSLPCRAIGGDFIEFRESASGPFQMAVGDVSGKGPAAALVASMLQGMYCIVSAENQSPGEALDRLNRALYSRDIAPRFATLVTGALAGDGRFTYSNAGHTPLILLSATGARLLEAGGPILGTFEDAAFPEETLALAPGDTVIAFSDGVTEAETPGGEPFGMDRMLAAAAAGRHLAPAALLASFFETMHEFCEDALPADDMTVAVLTFAPTT